MSEYFTDLEKSLGELGTTTVNIGGTLTGFGSYRGNYSELAMVVNPWGGYHGIPADELLAAIKKARSQTFKGHKGGEYNMKNAKVMYVVDQHHSGQEVVGLNAKHIFGETTTVFLATVDNERY